MQRWRRPRSRFFRTMLAMALLAWAGFTSSAFAAAFQTPCMPATAAASVTPAVDAAHCDDAVLAPSAAPRTPMQPMDQHGCCAGGCHCIGTCGAAITAPYAAAGIPPARARVAWMPRVKLGAVTPDLLLRPPIA